MMTMRCAVVGMSAVVLVTMGRVRLFPATWHWDTSPHGSRCCARHRSTTLHRWRGFANEAWFGPQAVSTSRPVRCSARRNGPGSVPC